MGHNFLCMFCIVFICFFIVYLYADVCRHKVGQEFSNHLEDFCVAISAEFSGCPTKEAEKTAAEASSFNWGPRQQHQPPGSPKFANFGASRHFTREKVAGLFGKSGPGDFNASFWILDLLIDFFMSVHGHTSLDYARQNTLPQYWYHTRKL